MPLSLHLADARKDSRALVAARHRAVGHDRIAAVSERDDRQAARCWRHASEVAREWHDVAEPSFRRPCSNSGIPVDRIGAPDYERGGVIKAFLPDERWAARTIWREGSTWIAAY